jgi:hypothetical protein
MTRFLMTLVLAVTCTLAGTNVAADDFNSLLPDHNSSVSRLNTPDLDLRLFTYPRNTENSSRVDQARSESTTEIAQVVLVPVARACYTYAGPVCQMAIALPSGSSCACYDAWGNSLSGVAY